MIIRASSPAAPSARERQYHLLYSPEAASNASAAAAAAAAAKDEALRFIQLSVAVVAAAFHQSLLSVRNAPPPLLPLLLKSLKRVEQFSPSDDSFVSVRAHVCARPLSVFSVRFGCYLRGAAGVITTTTAAGKHLAEPKSTGGAVYRSFC